VIITIQPLNLESFKIQWKTPQAVKARPTKAKVSNLNQTSLEAFKTRNFPKFQIMFQKTN
jgi:hypothetical protein